MTNSSSGKCHLMALISVLEANWKSVPQDHSNQPTNPANIYLALSLCKGPSNESQDHTRKYNTLSYSQGVYHPIGEEKERTKCNSIQQHKPVCAKHQNNV